METRVEHSLKRYLASPLPLWGNRLTRALVNAKINSLTWDRYNTVNALFGSESYIVPKEPLSIPCATEPVYLEFLSTYLTDFYMDHGLEPVTHGLFSTATLIAKLGRAFCALGKVQGICEDVSLLVRCIQVLQTSDEETDVSYSHPDIPFSIFVSVCQEDSIVSDLRLAESVLHEAMHLKLTLIEKHCPLILSGSDATYYSPWRDERRPVRGVLHGLFVFRAVYDFYSRIKNVTKEHNGLRYLGYRQEDIRDEFSKLMDFSQAEGLTENGANLAANLLPLN